ncbi:hypothetical protein GCM10008932_15710 [Alkalibacterium iburiense]|uniref:Uncharacterized protein n=1 Tax=Alkalibacterium iburiense TaxID=290589 RepID=A0ABP3H9J7_9LACT
MSFNILFLLTGIEFILVGTALVVVSVFSLLLLIYIFPYISRYESTIKDSIKTTFQIALLNIKSTLSILVYFVGFIILFNLTDWTFSLGLLLLITIGFSSISYLVSYILRDVFSQYE